jgi:sulfate adenylyltransferase subunit 1
MDLLRFITCGSVDDGKSTLIGRLLFDSQSVSLDILNAIERQTKNKANGEIDLSLLTDGLRAEREQGITIDIAYKYFTTKKRKFIVADAPGHVQYTRNMVTGASNADLAIVLIDARLGVIEQTRRHSLISSLLGIPHVVVAINKMDLVGFAPSVYDKIVSDYQVLAAQLGIKDVAFIPISALQGDNVVEKSDNMPFYKGKTLLEYLETIEVTSDINLTDPRFQVQYVIRPMTDEYHDYRGYAGKIQSGIYRVGDKVTVLPSGIESTISRIEVNLKDVREAYSGQAAVLHLADDIDISRGDSIITSPTPTLSKGEREKQSPALNPQFTTDIEATLCWFDETRSLTEGGKFLLQNGSNVAKAVIKKIEYKLDVSTLEKVSPLREDGRGAEGRLNDIVHVKIKTAKPLVFDNYTNNRATGAFILINENTCNTVAAGMIATESKSAKHDFNFAVEDFQSFIQAGKTLEAIEKYYADDVQVQENNDAPRVGKETALAHEKTNIERVKSFKIAIKSSVADENQGLVLGEMVIELETLKGHVKHIEEAFVQRWKDGKIVFERFYYEG